MTEPTEPTEPTVWTVKHPDALTMAEFDEVMAVTGIDISGEGMTWGKICAALVTWTRRKDGEAVQFADVYATLTNGQFKVSRVDPTNG